MKKVVALVFLALAVLSFSAFPLLAQAAPVPGDPGPAVPSQMIYLMLAGFAVTALTGLVKKIGGDALDGTAAQRIVASIMTGTLFLVVKAFDLAPDLTSTISSIIAFLVTSYGLSAGTYAHTKDLKPGDPAQLAGPPK